MRQGDVNAWITKTSMERSNDFNRGGSKDVADHQDADDECGGLVRPEEV